MKILLTGSSGMIGSNILNFLLKTTNDSFVCVESFTRKGEPFNLDKAVSDWSRVKVITHDLAVPFTEKTKKEIGEIDMILNIASDSHVDRSITHPVDFIQNNVNLAINMLELAREKKPKLFLQFSTDEVYGAAKENELHAEWSPIIPSNPYSASKACQEAIAISYWRTYGVPVIITNTMNVFCENQDWEKYIPLCVKKILLNEEIAIHSYPGATKAGSRFYIHTQSVAEAVRFLISKPVSLYPDSDKPDRYNIVGDREVNNLELAKLIACILKKPLKYKLVDFHSQRPGHDTRYALDGTTLKNFGWNPTQNFDFKIEETVLKLKERFDTEYSK